MFIRRKLTHRSAPMSSKTSQFIQFSVLTAVLFSVGWCMDGAHAQTQPSVRQVGIVTPNNIVVWNGNQTIKDGGSPATQTINLGTSASVTNPRRTGDAGTGLFSPIGSTVAIATASGEILRATATGVGIGTTNPGTNKLDLNGSTSHISFDSTGTILQFNSGGASSIQSQGVLEFENSGNWPNVILTNNINSRGNSVTGMGVGNQSNTQPLSNLAVFGNATIGTTYYGSAAPNDGLLVQGNVGLGTTSPSQALTLGSSSLLGWDNAGTADVLIGRQAAATIRLGAADVASPVPQTLSVQNVVTGTSNTAGADFTINASQATGTGKSGNIIIQNAAAGGSGSTVNALVPTMILSGGGVSIGTNVPTAGPYIDLRLAALNNPSLSVDTGAFQMRNGSKTEGFGMGLQSSSPFGTWLQAHNSGGQLPLLINPLSTTSAGGVGIGTTNPAALFDVNGGANMRAAVTMPGLASSSAAQTGTVCWTTGTGNLTVDTTTTCLLSSMRFKKDIEPLKSAMEIIKQLKPITFVYKDPDMGNDRLSGLIAEDVASVDMTLVELDKDKLPYKVRYDGLAVVDAKAIQEIYNTLYRCVSWLPLLCAK